MTASMEPQSLPTVQVEDDRTGLSITTLRRAMADNLFYVQGKYPEIANKNDFYMALAYTVRDRLLQRWINTTRTYVKGDVKVVCYLSAWEFSTRCTKPLRNPA
jgi:glycogen phosphorylase